MFWFVYFKKKIGLKHVFLVAKVVILKQNFYSYLEIRKKKQLRLNHAGKEAGIKELIPSYMKCEKPLRGEIFVPNT